MGCLVGGSHGPRRSGGAMLTLLRLPFLRSRHARIPLSRLQRRHADGSDALSTLDAKEALPPRVALLCYPPMVRPSSGSRGKPSAYFLLLPGTRIGSLRTVNQNLPSRVLARLPRTAGRTTRQILLDCRPAPPPLTLIRSPLDLFRCRPGLGARNLPYRFTAAPRLANGIAHDHQTRNRLPVMPLRS